MMAILAQMSYNTGNLTQTSLGVSAPKPVLITRKVSSKMTKEDSTPRTIEIPLTQGYVAIVDEQDADLAAYKWHTSIPGSTTYAARNTYIDRKRGSVYMHQTILERVLGRSLNKGELVDHINHIGTDNRRENLRLVDHRKNLQNSRLRIDNQTGYKGISPARHGFTARIKVNNKQIPLGRYQTAIEAACAYNAAAVEHFGEFSSLNDIPNWQEVFASAVQLTGNFRNSSGYRGVHKKRNKWKASIYHDGKSHALGSYDTPEQANEAVQVFLRSIDRD